jgi:hypothetical protein
MIKVFCHDLSHLFSSILFFILGDVESKFVIYLSVMIYLLTNVDDKYNVIDFHDVMSS